MRFLVLFLLNFLISCNGLTDSKIRRFPDDFLFGVATSAYQVEGAWNIDGKGESNWDRFLHDNPEIITDGRNGDVACDSYHLWKRDVEMLRELGVDVYRLSISWARVMPTGLPDSINEKGFEYYDNLIDELLKYNIQPMVTLFHFDLPQVLEDQGGWLNPQSTTWFEDYAEVVFARYASKVKFWVTVNQPNQICINSYELGEFAPGLNLNSTASYTCIKNVMIAHAKAYRVYEKLFQEQHEGKVGIVLLLDWRDPVDNSTINVEATERALEFDIGLYANPILSKTGDFPDLVKAIVKKKSMEQGFTESRLPTLTSEEIELIKGSADFIGMNYYTTNLVQDSTKEFKPLSTAEDKSVEYSEPAEWEQAESSWLKNAPYGIYKSFMYLNKMYDYPVFYITEQGWSTAGGLEDQIRVDVIREHLDAILQALEDGTQLKGYTAWSLMDNIEWVAGSSERFGLYQVDFESPTKNRTARVSALFYKNVIETRVVDLQWEPKSLKMEITNKN